ncbi:uncharacterized protein LOC144715333 isoform X2 [Wolffia australiana]
MQAGRSCWAGQRFAMAKGSDFEGKKHRSRMTKEERKKVVESFVTRHRASNNGKFPSLNLTHKEVGGSFYIVREIVREIIQENRILCPGNTTSPSFTLDNSSLVSVQPSRIQRWEDVSISNENLNAAGIRDSAMGDEERGKLSEDEESSKSEIFACRKLKNLSLSHDDVTYSDYEGLEVQESSSLSSEKMASLAVDTDHLIALMEGLPSVSSMSSAFDASIPESVKPPSSVDKEHRSELRKLAPLGSSGGQYEQLDSSESREHLAIVENKRISALTCQSCISSVLSHQDLLEPHKYLLTASTGPRICRISLLRPGIIQEARTE